MCSPLECGAHWYAALVEWTALWNTTSEMCRHMECTVLVVLIFLEIWNS